MFEANGNNGIQTHQRVFSKMQEAQVPCVPLQKAVRVTTIMKRLRAPEQSDSRSNSPAAGATAPLPAATDASSPPSSTTVPEGGAPAPTEIPAAGGASQPPPEAAAPAVEPQADVQEVEPASRCNGESSTALCAATETGHEQG